MEHFEEQLYRPPSEIPRHTDPAGEDLYIDLQPPSKEEIKVVIEMFRNDKTAGPDGIPGDAL